MNVRLTLCALALMSLGLAGCHDSGSGSPTSSTPPASGDPTPPAAATGTVTVKISFPVNAQASASPDGVKAASRASGLKSSRKSYLSPKTQSVSVNVTGVNGSAPANVIAAIVDVKQGSDCTLSGATLDCTVSIAAPVGTDTFEVRTWPGTQGAGTTPISGGTGTADVTANGNVSLAVNLLPYVASAVVDINPGPGVLPIGAAGTFTVRVRGRDSAGDIITGADDYNTPITITSTEIGVAGAHVTAAPTLPVTFNSPATDTITLTYDGAGSAASYAFSVTNGSVPKYYITFASSGEHLYLALRDTNEIDVFDINADGSMTGPSRVIKGSSTGINNPHSIAVDSLGQLYVANDDSLALFASGVSGNVAPIQKGFVNASPYYVSTQGRIVLNKIADPNNPGNTIDMANILYPEGALYSSDSGLPAPIIEPFSEGSNANAVASYALPNGVGYLCIAGFDLTGPSYSRIFCMNLPVSEIDGPNYSALDYPNISIVNHAANNVIQCCQSAVIDIKFLPNGALMASSEATYYSPAALTTYALPGGQVIASLQGDTSMIANPGAIDFDSNGNTYVVEHGFFSGGSMILQFAPGATGLATPLHTLQGFSDIGGIAIGK